MELLESEKYSCSIFGEDRNLKGRELLKVAGFALIIARHGLQGIGSARHSLPLLAKG